MVVVDRERQVQVWNASSHELWGLRSDEVEGRQLLSLDVNLPLDELRDPIDAALGSEGQSSELTVEAVNRRGKTFSCWVRVLPLRDGGDQPYGAILLMADREAAGRLVGAG